MGSVADYVWLNGKYERRKWPIYTFNFSTIDNTHTVAMLGGNDSNIT
jgi:hypothetical protein